MAKLLIIADDFTGALDTGVQFAESGAVTEITVSTDLVRPVPDSDVEVMVIDAETRHMNPKDAYNTVADIVCAAQKSGITHIYKKTDSALRGNIGAELAALYANTGKDVQFIPAFPQMKRITKDGIHYIDSVPVSESMFGNDPYEPVRHSAVQDIIKEQSDCQSYIVGRDSDKSEIEGCHGILIHDCTSEDEMQELGQSLYEEGKLHVCAGCAGFASVFPALLGLNGEKRACPKLAENLLVVCGSVNPVTLSQLGYAEKHGTRRVHVEPTLKLGYESLTSEDALAKLSEWAKYCTEEGALILDSNDMEGRNDTRDFAEEHRIALDDLRVGLAEGMGRITQGLLDEGLDATLMISGGDTLLGFMNQVGVYSLRPICEIAPGAVLSGFSYKGRKYYVVSKSGGFGAESLIEDLKETLRKES